MKKIENKNMSFVGKNKNQVILRNNNANKDKEKKQKVTDVKRERKGGSVNKQYINYSKFNKNMNGGFYTGTTTLLIRANNKTEAINCAIGCASDLPSWEIKQHNHIEYREGKTCCYHYITTISKINYVKVC